MRYGDILLIAECLVSQPQNCGDDAKHALNRCNQDQLPSKENSWNSKQSSSLRFPHLEKPDERNGGGPSIEAEAEAEAGGWNCG